MIDVGMDVHTQFTLVDLFDAAREPSRRHRTVKVPTTREGLESVLKPLNGQCRVAYEIGPQAQWVASIVRPLATEMQVANPSRIPWLFRDGRKNDKLDARKLATLLALNQLPVVHLPRAEISMWQALINYRRSLVRRRSIMKNQIRSILRTFAYRCPHKSLWTRVGQRWLTSLSFDEGRTLMLQVLQSERACVDAQLQKVEDQLDAWASRQPAVALLRTIPGIGPRTAEAIVAYTDVVQRFRNRKQFASYFGMTPKQDSSGLIERHGHISKRGPSVVRWVLVEAVHRVTKWCAPMRAYFDRIWRGKKDRYKKAIVATGRKLLTIAFAMLRDGTPFLAERVRPMAVTAGA